MTNLVMIVLFLIGLSSGENGVLGEVHLARYRSASLPLSSVCFDSETEELSQSICAHRCQGNKGGNQCAAFTFNATTLSCQCGLVKNTTHTTDDHISTPSIPKMMVNSDCPKGELQSPRDFKQMLS